MKIKSKIIGLFFLLLSTCLPLFVDFVNADETISSGLTLTIPSQGAKGWATTFKNSFATKISEHDHTGSGKGLQISTNAIASNAVTDAKIRLTNNSYLRARNAANSADLDVLKVDASNVLRFATGQVGANTRADLGLAIGSNVQQYDAELACLAGVTSAADKVPYFTGSGTAAVADFTSAGRALLDDADASAQRTTLSLVPGTHVQIQDTELSALAGLTSAADTLPYFNGSGTATTTTLTTAGRALIDDASASAQATTLGLGTGNSPTFTGLNLSGLTASLPVVTDASKNLSSMTAANFKSTFSVAGSGTNTDITAVNGIARNTWSPSATGNGSMTISSIVTRNTDYARVGPFVYIHMVLSFTVGGTPNTIISIDAPVSGVADDSGAAFPCAAEQGSTSYGVGNSNPGQQQCRWRYIGGTTNGIAVFLTGSQNWSAGSTTVHINGFYLAV